MIPLKRPDLRAEIHFLTAGDGGRSSSVMSGYRPDHNFGHPDGEINGAVREYDDGGWIVPGASTSARMQLIAPERNARRLFVGMAFTVQEGAQIVAHGRILEVLNPSLVKTEP